MKQFHDIQLAILKKLLFAQSLKYSELKPDASMENNQLSFHLDFLVETGYVTKISKGYTLTVDGKEYANRMDTEKQKIERQAKIGVLMCCYRKEGEEKEFLIYTRLKQPFYGKQWFMTGKVAYGETVEQTAIRELKEETNLDGKPQLAFIRHYLVYEEWTQKLLEDKFFYVCLFENPLWNVIPCKEGKYERIKKSELKSYLTNPFQTGMDRFQFLKTIEHRNGKVNFEEHSYFTSDF